MTGPRRRTLAFLVAGGLLFGSTRSSVAIQGSSGRLAEARFAREVFVAQLLGGLAQRVAVRTEFREGSLIHFDSGLVRVVLLATWLQTVYQDALDASFPQGDGTTSDRVMRIRARFATYPVLYVLTMTAILNRFLLPQDDAKSAQPFDLAGGTVTFDDYKASGTFKVLGAEFDRYDGAFTLKMRGVIDGGEHSGRTIKATYKLSFDDAARDFGN